MMIDARSRRLQALLGPDAAEVGCDECFEHLDESVEAELLGRPVDEVVTGMGAHLVGCGVCREEHDALLALVLLDQVRTRRPAASRPRR